MGNYIQKVITVFTIIPYISKWFNLNKQQKIYKGQTVEREANSIIEWGQFIELEELNNYNRDKTL
tara:strand:+ start:485 stop:679 length:195 start_codon:yes stop_codon:yes gene_type:complete